MSIKIQHILLKTVLFVAPLLVVTLAYSYSVHALANYIFNQTSAQFLK